MHFTLGFLIIPLPLSFNYCMASVLPFVHGLFQAELTSKFGV